MPQRLLLFAFPHAGGSIASYRNWRRALPPHVELRPVELPGRAHRGGHPHTSMAQLVEEIGPKFVASIDGPFVLFGHSLGALVSFELARFCQCRGHRLPERLVVSGRRAPHLRGRDQEWWKSADADFLQRLVELGGIPAELLIHGELVQHLLPVLRADVQLSETYLYAQGPPLRCALTAFGGVDDEESREGRLDAWGTQTERQFARHLLPGGHFFLHDNETEFLSLMSTELNSVWRDLHA